MPGAVQIRPFRRDDRAQLTDLVNAHAGAVLPGVSVSADAILSQLERDPGEYVVDPWAVERSTFVASVHDRVVAAAHLVRYGFDARVAPAYRGAGEVKWLVAWPAEAEPDGPAAALLATCVERLAARGASPIRADGALPVPGVFGVPDAWPHIHSLYEHAGFAHGGRVETLLLAEAGRLPRPGAPPVDGLALRRHVGRYGTVFSALAGDRLVGFAEVQADLTAGGTLSRLAGWAELGDVRVEPDLRRRGVAGWLLGHAGAWLALAGARLLLATTVEAEDEGGTAFLRTHGFEVLAHSRRGYERAAG